MKVDYSIYENEKLEIKLREANEFPYLFLSILNKSEDEKKLKIQVELELGKNLVTADSVDITASPTRVTISSLSHLSVVNSQTLKDLHFSVFIKGLNNSKEVKNIYKKRFTIQCNLKYNVNELGMTQR
jgi:hypothetical protein